VSDHLRIKSVYWFVTDKTSKLLTFVLLHHLPFVLSGVHVFLMLFVFTYTGVQHDFHIKWCSCRVTVKRRVSLVEQELIFLLEHLSSLPVFSGVRVARSLVLCVLLIIICLFSVGHCIVCPSIYGFWLPLWCLQTSLNNHENVVQEM
jgi:hypothetical protein